MKRDWQRLLREAQDEVARHNPHPYYLQAYRSAETDYWLHIPQWIFEDSLTQPVQRCLDIGCAYGTLALFSRKACGCEVFCTDFLDVYLSPSLIKQYGFSFAVNNIEFDPFPWPLDFDHIIFTEVLEHLNFHPVPTLIKLRSLLSAQGRLYLSTPDASQWGRVTKYYSRLDEIPEPTAGRPAIDDHIYQYTEDELLETLDQAGLRVEKFAYAPGQGKRHFNFTLLSK